MVISSPSDNDILNSSSSSNSNFLLNFLFDKDIFNRNNIFYLNFPRNKHSKKFILTITNF